MFPAKDGWSSLAEFHTYEQDVAMYGRSPDVIFDVGLTDEDAASDFAQMVKSDPNQVWSLSHNNCATVTTEALNAGGTNLPTNKLNSPLQLDGVLGMGADAPKGMTSIPVVRVSGRLKSQNKSITEEK